MSLRFIMGKVSVTVWQQAKSNRIVKYYWVGPPDTALDVTFKDDACKASLLFVARLGISFITNRNGVWEI